MANNDKMYKDFITRVSGAKGIQSGSGYSTFLEKERARLGIRVRELSKDDAAVPAPVVLQTSTPIHPTSVKVRTSDIRSDFNVRMSRPASAKSDTQATISSTPTAIDKAKAWLAGLLTPKTDMTQVGPYDVQQKINEYETSINANPYYGASRQTITPVPSYIKDAIITAAPATGLVDKVPMVNQNGQEIPMALDKKTLEERAKLEVALDNDVRTGATSEFGKTIKMAIYDIGKGSIDNLGWVQSFKEFITDVDSKGQALNAAFRASQYILENPSAISWRALSILGDKSKDMPLDEKLSLIRTHYASKAEETRSKLESMGELDSSPNSSYHLGSPVESIKKRFLQLQNSWYEAQAKDAFDDEVAYRGMTTAWDYYQAALKLDPSYTSGPMATSRNNPLGTDESRAARSAFVENSKAAQKINAEYKERALKEIETNEGQITTLVNEINALYSVPGKEEELQAKWDMAVKLKVQQQLLTDAVIDGASHAGAYTWVGEPERYETFLNNRAVAELIKGAPLTVGEERRIKSLSTNLAAEFWGEAIFDVTNLADMGSGFLFESVAKQLPDSLRFLKQASKLQVDEFLQAADKYLVKEAPDALKYSYEVAKTVSAPVRWLARKTESTVAGLKQSLVTDVLHRMMVSFPTIDDAARSIDNFARALEKASNKPFHEVKAIYDEMVANVGGTASVSIDQFIKMRNLTDTTLDGVPASEWAQIYSDAAKKAEQEISSSVRRTVLADEVKKLNGAPFRMTDEITQRIETEIAQATTPFQMTQAYNELARTFYSRHMQSFRINMNPVFRGRVSSLTSDSIFGHLAAMFRMTDPARLASTPGLQKLIEVIPEGTLSWGKRVNKWMAEQFIGMGASTSVATTANRLADALEIANVVGGMVQSAWINFVLTLNPRYYLGNFIDNTIRTMPYGGNPLEDVALLNGSNDYFVNLGRSLGQNLPAELGQGLARTDVELNESVFARLTSSGPEAWRPKYGALSYVAYEYRRLKNLRQEERMLRATALSEGGIPRFIQNLATTAGNLIEGTLGGLKDFNTSIEMTARVRTFHRNITKILAEGEPLFIEQARQGISSGLTSLTDQLWKAAEYDPNKLRAMVNDITSPGTFKDYLDVSKRSTDKMPLWSILIPDEVMSRLDGLSLEEQRVVYTSVRSNLSDYFKHRVDNGLPIDENAVDEFVSAMMGEYEDLTDIHIQNSDHFRKVDETLESFPLDDITDPPMDVIDDVGEGALPSVREVSDVKMKKEKKTYKVNASVDALEGETMTLSKMEGDSFKVTKTDGVVSMEIGSGASKETVREALGQAFAKSNEDYIRLTFSMSTDDFAEHVFKPFINDASKVSDTDFINLVTRLESDEGMQFLRAIRQGTGFDSQYGERVAKVLKGRHLDVANYYETLEPGMQRLVAKYSTPEQQSFAARSAVANVNLGNAVDRLKDTNPELYREVTKFMDLHSVATSSYLEFLLWGNPGPKLDPSMWKVWDKYKIVMYEQVEGLRKNLVDTINSNPADALTFVQNFNGDFYTNFLKNLNITNLTYDESGILVKFNLIDHNGKTITMKGSGLSKDMTTLLQSKMYKPTNLLKMAVSMNIDPAKHGGSALHAIQETLQVSFNMDSKASKSWARVFNNYSEMMSDLTGRPVSSIVQDIGFSRFNFDMPVSEIRKMNPNMGVNRFSFVATSKGDLESLTGQMADMFYKDMLKIANDPRAPGKLVAVENIKNIHSIVADMTGKKVVGFLSTDEDMSTFRRMFINYIFSGETGNRKFAPTFSNMRTYLSRQFADIDMNDLVPFANVTPTYVKVGDGMYRNTPVTEVSDMAADGIQLATRFNPNGSVSINPSEIARRFESKEWLRTKSGVSDIVAGDSAFKDVDEYTSFLVEYEIQKRQLTEDAFRKLNISTIPYTSRQYQEELVRRAFANIAPQPSDFTGYSGPIKSMGDVTRFSTDAMPDTAYAVLDRMFMGHNINNFDNGSNARLVRTIAKNKGIKFKTDKELLAHINKSSKVLGVTEPVRASFLSSVRSALTPSLGADMANEQADVMFTLLQANALRRAQVHGISVDEMFTTLYIRNNIREADVLALNQLAFPTELVRPAKESLTAQVSEMLNRGRDDVDISTLSDELIESFYFNHPSPSSNSDYILGELRAKSLFGEDVDATPFLIALEKEGKLDEFATLFSQQYLTKKVNDLNLARVQYGAKPITSIVDTSSMDNIGLSIQAIDAEQEAVDKATQSISSRLMGTNKSIQWDSDAGVGAVPLQATATNPEYSKTYRVTMTSEDFLRLVPPRPEPPSAGLQEIITSGDSVARPHLEVKWNPETNQWKVVGHDGRGRAMVAQQMGAAVEVDIIHPTKWAKDITPEMRRAPIVPQPGSLYSNPITPMDEMIGDIPTSAMFQREAEINSSIAVYRQAVSNGQLPDDILGFTAEAEKLLLRSNGSHRDVIANSLETITMALSKSEVSPDDLNAVAWAKLSIISSYDEMGSSISKADRLKMKGLHQISSDIIAEYLTRVPSANMPEARAVVLDAATRYYQSLGSAKKAVFRAQVYIRNVKSDINTTLEWVKESLNGLTNSRLGDILIHPSNVEMKSSMFPDSVLNTISERTASLKVSPIEWKEADAIYVDSLSESEIDNHRRLMEVAIQLIDGHEAGTLSNEMSDYMTISLSSVLNSRGEKQEALIHVLDRLQAITSKKVLGTEDKLEKLTSELRLLQLVEDIDGHITNPHLYGTPEWNRVEWKNGVVRRIGESVREQHDIPKFGSYEGLTKNDAVIASAVESYYSDRGLFTTLFKGEVPAHVKTLIDDRIATLRDINYGSRELLQKKLGQTLNPDVVARLTGDSRDLALFQGRAVKGAYWKDGANRFISLGDKADQSTFMHEFWHDYTRELFDLSKNPDLKYDWARTDLDVLTKAAGLSADEFISLRPQFEAYRKMKSLIKSEQKLLDAGKKTASGLTIEQLEKGLQITKKSAMKYEKAEELIVNSGLAYFKNAKAPSPSLDGAYSRVKSWFSSLWDEINRSSYEVSDEIRAVFDRAFIPYGYQGALPVRYSSLNQVNPKQLLQVLSDESNVRQMEQMELAFNAWKMRKDLPTIGIAPEYMTDYGTLHAYLKSRMTASEAGKADEYRRVLLELEHLIDEVAAGNFANYERIGMTPPLRRMLSPNMKTLIRQRSDNVRTLESMRSFFGSLREHLMKGVNGNSPIPLLSQDEMAELAKWGDTASKSMADLTDVAVNGGTINKADATPLFTTGGALKKTNDIMIDYTSRTNLDSVMKSIFPFWMFPSRSLPFWTKTLATHPIFLSTYMKIQRLSEAALYQNGLVDRNGRTYRSYRGYVPLGSTGLWINPFQQTSAKYLLDLAYYGDEMIMDSTFNDKTEDYSPAASVIGELIQNGPLLGLYPSPWMKLMLSSFVPEGTFPTFPIIPQLNLISPRWKQETFFRQIPIVGQWLFDEVVFSDVSWKESEVERRLLEDLKAKYNSGELMDMEAEKAAVIQAITEKGSNPLWMEALNNYETDSMNSSRTSFFTGSYLKSTTDGKMSLINTKNQLEMMKWSLNNAQIGAAMNMPTDPKVREQMLRSERYDTPDAFIYNLYNSLGYVRNSQGDAVTGTERNQIVAQDLEEQTKTSQVYVNMSNRRKEYDMAVSQVPVGSPDYAKMTSELFSDLQEMANSLPPKGYYGADLTNQGLEDKITQEYWRRIQATAPSWRYETEEYSDYEKRYQYWLDNLPKMAQYVTAYESREANDEGAGNISSATFRYYLNQVQKYLRRDQNVDPSIANKLLASTTPEGLREHRLKNDDLVTALNQVYRTYYEQPFYDAIENQVGGNTSRYLEEKYIVENPEPTKEKLLTWLEKDYPGRFTMKDIEKLFGTIVEQDKVYDINKRRDAKQDERERKESEVWEILYMSGPSKQRDYQFENLFIDAHVGLPNAKDYLTVWYATSGKGWDAKQFEAFYRAVKSLATKQKIQSPALTDLKIIADAEGMNKEFQSNVAGALGTNFLSDYDKFTAGTLGTYLSMTSPDRKVWRKEHPEEYKKIQRYYDMRDEFAKQNPIWSQYYFKYVPGLEFDEDGVPVPGTGTPVSGSGGGSGYSTYRKRRKGVGGGGYRRSFSTTPSVPPVSWPSGLVNFLSSTILQEISAYLYTGQVLSQATITYLQDLAVNHPEWNDFIQDILNP